MSPLEVHSSSAAQWLQGLLAKGAPSQTGTQSSNGTTELPRDSTSISARAFQLNQAAGTPLKTDSQTAQPSRVSAAHHHHGYHSHHQTDHTSSGTYVAQAGVSNPAGIGSPGASASSVDGSPGASLDHQNGSFIQESARKAANDLRIAYSHVTSPEATTSHNRGSRSISVTA